MKTIKKVPIIPKYILYAPDELEDGVLYISKECKCALHLCLCGCKELVVTPLNNEFGWCLIENGDKVSLTPSIGNYNFECKSHYIITNNIANFV